jgi:hypothetical protein
MVPPKISILHNDLCNASGMKGRNFGAKKKPSISQFLLWGYVFLIQNIANHSSSNRA